MIFITVGTQLPFDRMIRAVDAWAGLQGPSDVFAQIGPAGFKPKHIEWAPFLSAAECRDKMERCSAVVAHAGMGSIITALELGKPIVVMPRLAEFREHRNDHQLATARRFLAQGRIRVAFDERQLLEKLDDLAEVAAGERISASASPQLLRALRVFVGGTEAPSASGLRWPTRLRKRVQLLRASRSSADPAVEGLATAGAMD